MSHIMNIQKSLSLRPKDCYVAMSILGSRATRLEIGLPRPYNDDTFSSSGMSMKYLRPRPLELGESVSMLVYGRDYGQPKESRAITCR